MLGIPTRKRKIILGSLFGAVLVLGSVALFNPQPNQAVSEWERMTPPPEVETATLFGAAAAYNPTLAAGNPQLGGYFAWAVGAKPTGPVNCMTNPAIGNCQGVAMRFNRYNWETTVLTTGTELRIGKSVATYLYDALGNGAGTDDIHRVWMVGTRRDDPNKGGIMYSETNSTTGTATPWDDCIGTSPCDPIVFKDGSGNVVDPLPLNDVDFYSGTFGLAVGSACQVWWTGDGGKLWQPMPTPAGCVNTDLTGVGFVRDFVNYNPSTNLNIPRLGFVWITGASTNQAWFSSALGFGLTSVATAIAAQNWNDTTAIYARNPTTGTNEYTAWLAGDGGNIRRAVCTSVATCTAAGFTDGGPGGQAGLGAVPLRSVAAYVDTTTPAKYMLWASGGTRDATDGAISFTLNPLASAASVLWQSQSINTAQSVYGLGVVNGTHAWAAGDKATLLKLSPGNVNGWLWIGADNCRDLCTSDPADPTLCEQACPGGAAQRTRPLGWLSVNCANTSTCQAATFNYGVNLKQKKEKVSAPTVCTDVDQDADVGTLSGFGWFGVSDENQTDPASGLTCAQNPAVCRPIGWLSFERTYFCDNDLSKTCRSNADCTAPGTCDIPGGTPPSAPFNEFGFKTACAKTIADNSPQEYVQTSYDYATDRLDGWARFVGRDHLVLDKGWVKLRGPYMCGTAWCSKDRSLQCNDDTDCSSVGAGFCDPSGQGAQPYNASCPTTADDSHYVKCTDCVTADPDGTPGNGDDYLTCSICKHVKTTDWWDASYGFRHQFRAQASSIQVEVGNTLSFPIDLDVAPFAGDVQPDYDDVRVVYRTFTGFYELQREIIKYPSVPNEQIRFKAVEVIAPNTPDDNYYLYYGNGGVGAPTVNRANVYAYFNDFSTDVFASGEWATSGCPTKLVHNAALQRIQSIQHFTDCYAYLTSPPLSIDHSVDGMHLEALISVPAFNPPGPPPPDVPVPQGALALFQSIPGAKEWAGINELGNDAYIRGTPPTGLLGSAPVPGGIDPDVFYSVHWEEKPNGLGNRLHSVWVDGQPVHSDLFEASPTFSLAFPGIHTWNTPDAFWDDYRLWRVVDETVSVASFVEEPFSTSAHALNPWSCNLCGTTGAANNTQCGTGRCLPDAPANAFNVCLTDKQCEPGPTHDDTNSRNDCQPAGQCSDTGEICFGEDPSPTPGLCSTGVCRDIGENVCNECKACSLYGVSVDTRGGALYGFGYSEDYGFIDFSFSFLYNRSWLQVLQGSIYSRSSVGSPATGKAPGIGSTALPEGRCNATYVIRSNGSIANVCTGFQTSVPSANRDSSPYIAPSFDALELPSQATNDFRTDSGILRIDELLTDTGGGQNKFKHTIVNIGPTGLNFDTMSAFLATIPNPSCLGNRIFYRKSATPFTIDVPWTTIQNCPGSFGKGTFVFEGGGLIIEQNTAYDASVSAQTISELAALGIMVIRDRTTPLDVNIVIRKTVRNTVGNFFVEGEVVTEGTATSTQPDDPYRNDGVMVAQSFKFGRRIKGPVDNPQPSEIILNDGRISLNPPPGFEGFSENLPRIQESVP